MRTDVKIGVGVGLVVALIAIVYFVTQTDKKPPVPEGDNGGGNNVPVVTPTRTPEPSPVVRERPRLDLGPTLEGPTVSRPDTAPARPVPVVVERTTPTPGVSGPAVTVESRTDRTPEPIRPTPVPVVVERPAPLTPPVPERLVPPPVATEQTYTIKQGDAGFWQIAQKVYGDGKHWPLIAKANPATDSSHLRVGQVLKIPPLPAATTVSAGIAGRATPDGAEAPAGKKVYVVQAGDSGYWAIAQKVYGDGRLWNQIAKDNPGLDSNALKVGMKVYYTPKGEGASVLPTAPRTTTTAPARRAPAPRIAPPTPPVSPVPDNRPSFD